MPTPVSPSVRWIYGSLCAALLVAVPVALSGCGTEKAGAGTNGVNCPSGQLLDQVNNKCVDNPANADANVVGTDSGGSSSSGSSSGSSGSSGGSEVQEKELPWALDDSGGLAKDTSAPFDAWWECPPEKKNPTGKLHGKKCDKDGDCLYGRCMIGGPLTVYNDKIKFCTKNNGCGSGDLVSCSKEHNIKKALYFDSVFEKSVSGGNTKRDPKKDVRKMCAYRCKSHSDCTKWNAELPHCMKTSNKFISFGTNGICGVDPDK